jgi:hypothetical protein
MSSDFKEFFDHFLGVEAFTLFNACYVYPLIEQK